MPNKKPAKLRPDMNEIAFRVMMEATGQAPKTLPGDRPKNADAVKRGREGGKVGGPARAASMSGRKRKGSARNAAEARWRKSEP